MSDSLHDAGAKSLSADAEDSTVLAPTIGIDEAGSMFIMNRGAGASFFKGEWRPGILFEGRDLMNFSRIADPEEVDALMNQADSALAASLEQHIS